MVGTDDTHVWHKLPIGEQKIADRISTDATQHKLNNDNQLRGRH